MGHLFYDEGNLTARQNITSSITLTGIFMNVQNTGYWSGTESSASGGWYFITSDGSQSYTSKGLLNHAWAVRPGQITAAAPLPGTAGLMALGLLGLGAGRVGRQAILVIRSFG